MTDTTDEQQPPPQAIDLCPTAWHESTPQDQTILPGQTTLPWQTTLSWQPDATQQTQFQQLYELILAGNRQLNLTRITEPNEFWEKHVWDSLRGILAWQDPSDLRASLPPLVAPDALTTPFLPMPAIAQVIDIGTGAGFPGIPVAIAQPHWQVTLLDSTRKKMAFLETLVTALDLSNIQTVTDRAESLGHHPQHRSHYDLALIRAVAEAAVCAEYALPLVKLGGTVVLYRGQWSDTDSHDLKLAIAPLGGAIANVTAFTTPLSQGTRHCIYLQKTAPTPETFPRAIGIPAKHPLGKGG